MNAREYLALPRAPQSWIIDQVLPTGGLLNIYGPPKAGKTYAALDAVMAISDPARSHFMEWRVLTHGPAWYLQLDTPRNLFHEEYLERVIRYGHTVNGISVADAQMVPYPFNIVGEGKLWLQQALTFADQPPVALVVDTLRDSHGHDENDSGVMRNVVAAFVDAVRVIEPTPALIFLSHEKKLDPNLPVDLMSGNRGSNYLAGRMDCVMRVAHGVIMAQGRTLQLTTLENYQRDKRTGLWVKFDKDAEIRRYLVMDFDSAHERHEAFAAEWGCSTTTAQNYFKNFATFGSWTKRPHKKD